MLGHSDGKPLPPSIASAPHPVDLLPPARLASRWRTPMVSLCAIMGMQME